MAADLRRLTTIHHLRQILHHSSTGAKGSKLTSEATRHHFFELEAGPPRTAHSGHSSRAQLPQCSFTRPASYASRSIFKIRVLTVRTLPPFTSNGRTAASISVTKINGELLARQAIAGSPPKSAQNSSRALLRGKSSAGIGTSRKRQSGSQPSTGLKTSSRSAGIVARTLSLLRR